MHVGRRSAAPPRRRWIDRVRCPRTPFIDGAAVAEQLPKPTAVALWIAAGANPKQVAARAGHTSVSVVLHRYGHLLPDHDAELIRSLELPAPPPADRSAAKDRQREIEALASPARDAVHAATTEVHQIEQSLRSQDVLDQWDSPMPVPNDSASSDSALLDRLTDAYGWPTDAARRVHRLQEEGFVVGKVPRCRTRQRRPTSPRPLPRRRHRAHPAARYRQQALEHVTS